MAVAEIQSKTLQGILKDIFGHCQLASFLITIAIFSSSG
jgi:hypothetical protein